MKGRSGGWRCLLIDGGGRVVEGLVIESTRRWELKLQYLKSLWRLVFNERTKMLTSKRIPSHDQASMHLAGRTSSTKAHSDSRLLLAHH